MKDLPVRTLIAVLLIGLLCLVVWFGGWVQAAVLGLFTVAAVYEMFTIFVKRGIRPAVLPQILLGGSMFAVMYKFGARFILPMAAAAFVAIMVERILNARRTNEDLIASLALLVYPCLCLPASDLSGSAETIFRAQHSFAFLPAPAWLTTPHTWSVHCLASTNSVPISALIKLLRAQ